MDRSRSLIRVVGAAAACTLANYVSGSVWRHPWAPVTSGSVLAAGEPFFYLNHFFFAKKKTPTDTGGTSAFKSGLQGELQNQCTGVCAITVMPVTTT